MKYTCTLIAVRDMEQAKQFYHEYVHPLFEHSWGQRVVRFYDLDKHMIEVGENMTLVVKRFIDIGLSIEEIAARMDVPVDYVRSCLT